ncbi:aspartyl/asparaginyl beta-hydroxylase isoform X3 [Rana temporaria]|uniref:aspartyl/asparaginyl beta-hydroxylase isoform X3 n=1 Tax=Rana temporaria TaxID=8407 RepID=UPI001AACE68D|nr:aspartyl/asparaginyl beta-hydroxylase isoform X3 [Rana temporaria]
MKQTSGPKRHGNPRGGKRARSSGNNGKKGGLSGSSFFTWFMVIALLGVWTSVAVVWFELVDYEDVLAKAKDFRYNLSEVLQGKLDAYDTDGDGDFDIEDAKVLLGLKDREVARQESKESETDSQGTLENLSDQDLEDVVDGDLELDLQDEDILDLEDALDDHEPRQPDDYDENEFNLEDALEPSVHKSLNAEPEANDEPEEELVTEEQADDKEEETEAEEQVFVEEKVDVVDKEPPAPEDDDDDDYDDDVEAVDKEPTADEDDDVEDLPLTQAGDAEAQEPEEEEQQEVEEEPVVEEPEEEAETPDIESEEEPVVEEVAAEPLTAGKVEEPIDEENEELEVAAESEPEPYNENEDSQDEAEVPDYQQHEHREETVLTEEVEAEEEPVLEEEVVEDPVIEAEVIEEQAEDDAVPSEENEPIQTEEDESVESQADISEREFTSEEIEEVLAKTLEDGLHEELQETEEENAVTSEEPHEDHAGDESSSQKKEKAKKKKPKLLNKLDKTIKAELDAAEKLRKKGKLEEALKAFETLVENYPQSPRARYGKAQCEDDMAEKRRSNDVLLRAIGTYEEVSTLPNVPADLMKLALKRQANRQQFLGRMRGSVLTLHKLVQLYPDDISMKNDLGVGYLLLGDNTKAKEVYEEVLSQDPSNGFAKVHYGFILKADNKIAESIPYLRDGLLSEEPGTDDGRFYFHLGDALQRVGDKEAYTWYEAGHKKGHFASVWQRSLYNVNGLKAQPWWTAKETGYTDLVRALEANWKIIRDEGLAVMDKTKGLFVPEDENLREKGDWSQYTLWQQGRKNEKSCNSAPKTCALLERFPESTGCRRGQIKYSVMHPGTHVWPHTGPTNCRLRMHVGLVIPKTGCKIRCANDTRSWAEGKVLIFDDSFEHEVWQEADAYRLIFIVDVWHPELSQHQRKTLPAI